MKVHPVTQAKRILPATVALMSGAVLAGCDEPQHTAGSPLPPTTEEQTATTSQQEQAAEPQPLGGEPLVP